MAECELHCNYKHCRKALDGTVWVTSCSHIFCDEDGEKHFSQNLLCPACEATLSSESDFYKTSLNPSDQYKSMILAGQRPETIVDICSRALNFWNYQICQEKIYHEWVAKKLRDQSLAMEQQYKELLLKSQSESQALKAKLTNTLKDFGELRNKYEEVVEKYNDKLRQYQTLSSGYESLRKKALTPNIYGSDASAQKYRAEASKSNDKLRFRNLTNLSGCSPFFGQSGAIAQIAPPRRPRQSDSGVFFETSKAFSFFKADSTTTPSKSSHSSVADSLLARKFGKSDDDFILKPAPFPPDKTPSFPKN